MTEANSPSVWERSTLVRFFRWLFSWRGVRRILIVLAWTATILALFYAEENWRGRRKWNTTRKQLEARGEQLDFKGFIPKPIPDDQNFAATPLIQSWFVRGSNFNTWQDSYNKVSGKISSSKRASDRGHRHFTDLAAWEMAFNALKSGTLSKAEKFESDKLDLESRQRAAPAVLEGLKDVEGKLGELRTASQRPDALYPVVYKLDDPWGLLLPHLLAIKGACQRLQLMACAKLAAGQNDSALSDVKLILYLADSVKDEPLIISYLVRLACVQIGLQPIWEGLAEHTWSDEQLQELQTRLQNYEFLGDLKRPCDAERAAGVLTCDLLYQQKYRLSSLSDEFGAVPGKRTIEDFVAWIAPRGWYYQEQANYCRIYQNQWNGTYDTAKRRVYPRETEARDCELQKEVAGPFNLGREVGGFVRHNYLASLLVPALGRLPYKAATGQTSADQAVLACALERYRIANGKFPEKLEGLVSQFISRLPTDLVSGEPYKYRRTNDGQFVLYSIGWDERDDNGVPGTVRYADKQADWVW